MSAVTLVWFGSETTGNHRSVQRLRVGEVAVGEVTLGRREGTFLKGVGPARHFTVTAAVTTSKMDVWYV